MGKYIAAFFGALKDMALEHPSVVSFILLLIFSGIVGRVLVIAGFPLSPPHSFAVVELAGFLTIGSILILLIALSGVYWIIAEILTSFRRHYLKRLES